MNILLLLISLNIGNPAQTSFDAADFSAKFKKLIESAKTYYKTEKQGSGKEISGDDAFVKEFDCVTKFDGAVVSRIVQDHEDVCQHQVHYEVGTDKEAAIKLHDQIKALVTAGVPPKYKSSTTYDARYATSQASLFEFDSDVFAQVAKRPSVKMGVIEKDGKFFVEVLIIENVFRV